MARARDTNNSYDYIIIGAGSAGCVLVNRLSENGRHRVLVLEAGGSDRRFWIKVPIGYGKSFYNPAVNWMYDSEPDAGLGGRTEYFPRGKVLGGSSSINAMVYIRGQARDFDDWKAAGNPGWGADDVAHYFKKAEDHAWGASAHHGAGGPMHVADVRSELHPLCETYLRGVQETGVPYSEDFNADQSEGVGYYQINTRGGFRESAATAFLRPAMKRANVRVETKAHVTRILFEGRRAVGVEYQQNGATHTARAAGEVILSGGAINSPQVLQLSGIGPGALLQSHGIKTHTDSPAVGRNLQDHLGINYYYLSNQPTLNDQLRPWWGQLWAGMKYVLTRRGPLSISVNQAGGFLRLNPESPGPDIQLYFSPVSYTKSPPGERPLMAPDPWSGLFLSFAQCRPSSRGHVQIRSNDPFDAPIIAPNYLSRDDDVSSAIAACRYLRKLAATPAMSDVIERELHPGPDVTTDADILADFRARAGSVFHPSCTCTMGPDPATSVIDARLKVHGVDALRVVDASVFPNVTSGNTNAPTIMVAEKGADMIRADAG